MGEDREEAEAEEAASGQGGGGPPWEVVLPYYKRPAAMNAQLVDRMTAVWRRGSSRGAQLQVARLAAAPGAAQQTAAAGYSAQGA